MASLDSLSFKSIFRNRLFQDHDEDQVNLCLMTKSHENNKEEFVRKKWYIDSECSKHMTGDVSKFTKEVWFMKIFVIWSVQKKFFCKSSFKNLFCFENQFTPWFFEHHHLVHNLPLGPLILGFLCNQLTLPITPELIENHLVLKVINFFQGGPIFLGGIVYMKARPLKKHLEARFIIRTLSTGIDNS